MKCTSCAAQNPEQARFCGMCGAQLQRPSEARERRRVSIVFVDLAEFTSLTHGLDPEDLRDLADEVLTVVAGIIENYDGHVDAFKGDGLIALFGAPHSHPDDPQRAVLAAAASLRAIEAIGEGQGYRLKGRAGVNTGIVIAGAIGSGRIKNYTVMGSAVNLASRLEELAEPGEVWVGYDTYHMTKHMLTYAPSRPLDIRGFPTVTTAYKLVSVERPQHDPYGHLTFVGRELELQKMQEALERAGASQRPLQIHLRGGAGMGKTRLMQEFAARLGKQTGPKVVWLNDGATSRGHPWSQLASQLFPWMRAEKGSDKQRLALRLQEVFSSESPGWQRTILQTLGLDAEPETGENGRRSENQQAAAAWSRLLVNMSQVTETGAARPALVLLIDHGVAEKAVTPLLEQLLRIDAPILIVRASRETSGTPESCELRLAPLSQEESFALLAQLTDPALEIATQSLVAQVGGIPAYILELGRALSSTPAGSFSGSLASLLQARLDMLRPRERQLLAYAALTGERSWSGMLQAHFSAAELESLITRKLLVKEASSSIASEVELRFQSELLRNAVLRMMPFSERPAIHLTIATWLEQHAPLSLSTLIGRHFEAAGSFEAAYPHYLAAADLAASEGNLEECYQLYERLLELELSPNLKSQGALAYAQIALSNGNQQLGKAQLEHAYQSLLACRDKESAAELREVYEQLRGELHPSLDFR